MIGYIETTLKLNIVGMVGSFVVVETMNPLIMDITTIIYLLVKWIGVFKVVLKEK